jgi:RNA polymerase sigma-70 factor (ECF subfamily)
MISTSQSLLERLRNRDDGSAWKRLMAIYEPWLRGWLQRTPLQAADCDDIMQSVFTIVSEKIPEFVHNGHSGAFRTWLRSILAFRTRHFLREQRHRPGASSPQSLSDWLEQLSDPHSELSRQWDQEHDQYLVRRMLQSIQPEFNSSTWRVFQLLVLEEVPVAEVAERLGIKPNAVYVAKARVLSRLRAEVRGLVDEASG